jgi:hypothetical protein
VILIGIVAALERKAGRLPTTKISLATFIELFQEDRLAMVIFWRVSKLLVQKMNEQQ